ncbi:hypothetical protein L1987_79249 [Smallanthus sonchifolius]|uniref:Uncharacterized protein n=1 Tax=Smallanthus sonchifolius TaxID=185202 RepID=A0ACB8ZF52_9ASTR|nr:hypothetical protein L1987_79249 [Smallanthus sonchifolius]
MCLCFILKEGTTSRRRNDIKLYTQQTLHHHHHHHPLMEPATSLTSTKLRLMCSIGGHIVPRPHDKSLCYVGGETRMLVVDRHTTLLDLTHRMSKTVLRSPAIPTTPAKGSSFILKYLLPSEDLDSLISVTTDEDLENMIEEYERLSSSSRIRLFIFPTDPGSGSGSLIWSFLENSIKSEDWFVNALNGTDSGFSDASSVNLFGLNDEISLQEKEDVNRKGIIGIADLGGNNSGQDVNLIPDSMMMETTSSFGSASSAPSLANLPPVQQKQSTGFDLVSADSFISDLTNANDRAADPNDTFDQNPRIQMQHQIQNSACLLSIPTTQIDSLPNQLHHQRQYIHHHPSGAVPVTSYYQHHHPPIDQNFMYYARQLPQGYTFPLQQPHPSYDAPPPQPVMVPSRRQNQSQYVAYSEMHQPAQLMYYATQAMPPLPAAHYNKMASISPLEASLQEQVRSAQP